jgi:hypothetical protein
MIARLPYLERDMVNRMPFNNIPHAKIVDALADHECFVSARNISNWKALPTCSPPQNLRRE